MLLFQNLLYSSMTYDHVTCNKMCDTMSHNVTFYNITFTSNLKLKEIKNKNKNENKIESIIYNSNTLQVMASDLDPRCLRQKQIIRLN